MIFITLVDFLMLFLLSIIVSSGMTKQSVHILPSEVSPKSCIKLPCAGNVSFDGTQDYICCFCSCISLAVQIS